jgi:GT2 family glycosyltransferase
MIPDLSIVIINWRMGADVASVLPCIEGHAHACSIEVVLVNVPSGDGTEELVAQKHPWVRLISHPKFGIAELRNVGIRHARGRYLLMLDADTELLPGALDELVRFMDAEPRLGGCGGHTTRPDGTFEYNVKRFYDLATVVARRSPLERWWPENPWNRRHLMKDKDHTRAFDGDWMAGACFCMRRETVREVGLFDDRYYFGFEDVDWCWRAKLAGWRIAFCPDARIIHKVRRVSAKGWNRMALEHLKSGLRFWLKTRSQGMSWAVGDRPAALALHAGEEAPADAAAPDLSVIVLNYNCRELLRDCLASLREAAPRHRIETIVVDNASTDGAPDLVREEFADMTLIANRENLGFTRGNNQGIAIARGRHVLLLNNDTKVKPGALSVAVEALDADPSIGAAGLKLLNADGSLQLSCRRFPSFQQALFNRYSLLSRLFPGNRWTREYLMTDLPRDEAADVDWVSGACLIVRRAVLDAVGGLDERFYMYSEDVDFCYRVWQAGWRVTYLPQAEVFHYIGQSTKRARLKPVIERHRSMYRFYKKHYSREIMFLDFATAAMVAARGALMVARTWLGSLGGGRP